jgi:RNA polymerase sigma-70 factor, ECF subfamily
MSESSESIVVRLLRQAREGDEAARDELFTQCRNYVAIVARTQVESWMNAKVDASDLVQQTLLEAHRGFTEFRGATEAEWLAWLRQILAHNTHDFIRRFRADKRRVGREQRLDAPLDGPGGSLFHDPPDSGDSPSQFIAQQEREIELANAIARLSEDHQEVVVLRNLQRLSFNEVAERMGRSRPAVQMLWMRAIRKLEELLRESSACQ